MRTVTVVKEDLIAKINTTRTEHREQFLAAQEKYRERVIEELDRRLAEVRAGKPISLGFSLPEPQDYTHEYDMALEQLEWEIEDTVELDQSTFQELVLNQWAWARQFAATSLSYLS
jgi:hypothetical protein